MKCISCGHENREGVKFCEQCGAPLPENTQTICPSCGFSNREGVKFCEQCGAALQGMQKIKGTRFCPSCGYANRAAAKFCESCGAPLDGTPAAAPPPVTVVHPPRKKRRLNPLLLVVLLLLLLLSCCCLLLLFGWVETPVFAARYVDPLIGRARGVIQQIPVLKEIPWLPKGEVRDPVEVEPPKPVTCEDFRDILKEVKLAEWTYPNGDNECYTDLPGVAYLENLELYYSWDGAPKRRATCERWGPDGEDLRCYFPRDVNADRVDYWAAIDDCEEKLGYSDGWREEEEVSAQPPKPPLSEPECCDVVGISSPDYYRDPPEVGRLILIFELEFDGCKPVSGENILYGDVFVGPDQDEFWTSVECYDDLNGDDTLICESPGNIDQKKSKSKVALSTDNCYWEVEFSSPYYAPPEPSGCANGGSPCGSNPCCLSCCRGCGSSGEDSCDD